MGNSKKIDGAVSFQLDCVPGTMVICCRLGVRISDRLLSHMQGALDCCNFGDI